MRSAGLELQICPPYVLHLIQHRRFNVYAWISKFETHILSSGKRPKYSTLLLLLHNMNIDVLNFSYLCYYCIFYFLNWKLVKKVVKKKKGLDDHLITILSHGIVHSQYPLGFEYWILVQSTRN